MVLGNNHLTYPLEEGQDKPCKYNVIIRRFRITIVAVEKQLLLHIQSFNFVLKFFVTYFECVDKVVYNCLILLKSWCNITRHFYRYQYARI
jgi:hypothetical protein